MLKINVSSLKPGVKLAKDIFSNNLQLLLPKGTVITEERLESFAKRKIKEVYIIEPGYQDKFAYSFRDVYRKSLAVVETFMLEAKLGRNLEFKEIEITVELLMKQVLNQIDILSKMQLIKNKGDYLLAHSVNVALLCILLGRWLKCSIREIKELGLAGLLHDIGKIYIEEAILNKPGKLTKVEFEQVKKHTLLGYDFLRQSKKINLNIANAVLLHHERADGSGYPLGRKGYNVNFYAAIVAVADTYDALTSDRIYSPRRTPWVALEIIWHGSFGKLNPEVTKVFYDRVANSFVGKRVLLSNNQKGVIVYINPFHPTKPTVMVEDRFYDLAADWAVTIQEVVD